MSAGGGTNTQPYCLVLMMTQGKHDTLPVFIVVVTGRYLVVVVVTDHYLVVVGGPVVAGDDHSGGRPDEC